MREELHGELVEKHAEEWRPQRNGWLNPANSPTSRAALDKAITICVTKGRSVRTTHRLTKPRASIGKMGGGADKIGRASCRERVGSSVGAGEVKTKGKVVEVEGRADIHLRLHLI